MPYKSKENSKKYYQKNKDHLLKKSKLHYQKNKEQRKAKQKEYTKNNKEKIKKYHQDYALKNKGKIKKYQEKYHQENKEKNRISTRENKLKSYHKNKTKNKELGWRKKNPIKHKEYRIKNKRIMEIRTQTALKFKKDSNCYFCNNKLNLEFHHLIYKLPIRKTDFITICKPCHDKFHRLERKKEVLYRAMDN